MSRRFSTERDPDTREAPVIMLGLFAGVGVFALSLAVGTSVTSLAVGLVGGVATVLGIAWAGSGRTRRRTRAKRALRMLAQLKVPAIASSDELVLALRSAGAKTEPDAAALASLAAALHGLDLGGVLVSADGLHLPLRGVSDAALADDALARWATVARALGGFADPVAAWHAARAALFGATPAEVEAHVQAVLERRGSSRWVRALGAHLAEHGTNAARLAAAVALSDPAAIDAALDHDGALPDALVTRAVERVWRLDATPTRLNRFLWHPQAGVRAAAIHLRGAVVPTADLERLCADDHPDVAAFAAGTLMDRSPPVDACRAARRVLGRAAEMPNWTAEPTRLATALMAIDMLADHGEARDRALIAPWRAVRATAEVAHAALDRSAARHPNLGGGAMSLVEQGGPVGGLSTAEAHPSPSRLSRLRDRGGEPSAQTRSPEEREP